MDGQQLGTMYDRLDAPASGIKRFSTPGDESDPRARTSECLGDTETDTFTAAGDDRPMSGERKVMRRLGHGVRREHVPQDRCFRRTR